MTGRLIGVMGMKRAGKDEVAKAIMAQAPSFVRVAFADPMKRIAYAIDPVVVDGPTDLTINTSSYIRLSALVDAVGWEKAKEFPDVRRFLQRLGTEGGRNILGLDVWVDNTFETEVIPALNAGQSVVIPDTRFANEIKRVREAGGEVWRVDRPSLPLDESAAGTHASEVEWRKTKPDQVILNDGTLNELSLRVTLALKATVMAGL